MPVTTVPFAELVIDDAVNARAGGTSAAKVAEYAAERRAGKDFPPGRAFRGPDGVVLSRGFHRAKAYREAGDAGFPVEVVDGTRDDAEVDSCNDNLDHGLPRTNADKRHAVERILAKRPDWTQERVAAWCGVNHSFVGDITAELAAVNAQADDSQPGEFVLDTNSPGPNYGVERVSARGRKGEGRKRTKVAKAERVGGALKANADRTDEQVAAGTKTTPAFVAKIRKALEKRGVITPRDSGATATGDHDPPPAKSSGQPPTRNPDNAHADLLAAIEALAARVSRAVNESEPESKLRQYLLNVGWVYPRQKIVGERHYRWQCLGLRGVYRLVKLAGLPGKPRTKAQVVKAFEDANQPDEVPR